MAEKEKAYKVTGRLTVDYELIVQALNADEARYFSTDIDLEKWREIDSDWQVTDVTRSYFLKVVKGQEQVSNNNVSSGEQFLGMENNVAQKVIAFASILALPFALGAFVLAWAPAQQFHLSDPRGDGYVPPRSIEKLVKRVQDSTVTVFCKHSDPKKNTLGSAWAINLENDQGDKYPTTLITNHHVIDDCLDGKGTLTVAALYGKESPAIIDTYDSENDLASIATSLELKPLKLSEYEPWPGYWVAAIGSADGYEGSVAFGNVLNGSKYEVLITVPLSHGNSGGPLVDNEGNVVGTNTFGQIDEQYNGAMSLNALCVKIMECENDLFWKVEE